MKIKALLLLLLSLLIQPISSQELKEMEIEIVPESEKSSFIVRNPEESILIVHSTIPDLQFESNIAIIDVDKPDPGEYRLHLEPGTHIITFKADGYLPIKERYHIPVKEYKEVKIKPKKRVILQTEETQDITFQLNISNAIPVIDGVQGQPQFDKTIVIPLPEGEHDIQFLASGYKPSDVKIVKVRMGEQQTIPIDLRRDTEISVSEIPEIPYETVRFHSELHSVELIVEGINKGYINPIGTNVDLSASVDGTIHQVTCKKSKYHPETFATTVYKQKVNPPVKVKLKPNFGTLVVKCTQGDAKIYINDKLNRKTATRDGEVFEEFQSGTYKIRTEKERYFPSKEQEVVVKDGDKATVGFDLQARWGDFSLTSAPSSAVVYLDNEVIGKTPLKLQGEKEGLLEGKYKINLTLHPQFYPDEERTIEIKAGMSTAEHVVFTDISGKIRVDYTPKPINVFINGNLDDDLSSGKPKRFSEGSYKIQIQKVGSHKDSFKPVERSVVLYRGKEEVIEGKLPEKNGRIYISSNIGSPVFSIVDLETGEPIFEDSRNPNMLVLTGKYKISADLSSEGYIAQTKTVDITEGFSDRIVFEFTERHKQALIEEQEWKRREKLRKQEEIRLAKQREKELAEAGITDIDGNVYKIVKIGNQWWMAENLKVTHYRNGDPIPHVTSNSAWEALKTGAYCNYDNDANNATTYGSLYNWYAVSDSRNIAPEGWHVPSDAEWKTLEYYLGVIPVAGKMKETGTTHWDSPNTGATNESGFSALPGGYRIKYGGYTSMGRNAYFWSSTEGDSRNAWYLYLFYSRLLRLDVLSGANHKKQYGFSVRCVRD